MRKIDLGRKLEKKDRKNPEDLGRKSELYKKQLLAENRTFSWKKDRQSRKLKIKIEKIGYWFRSKSGKKLKFMAEKKIDISQIWRFRSISEKDRQTGKLKIKIEK